ncbi:MAG: hypothetical protein LBP31_01265 [Holosporales bacterium]|jgi:hypothetical protein|nr:hypothetical protein [Holosporales bacterium]
MHTNRKILKIKQHTEPFLSNDIDTDLVNFTIGDTDIGEEDVFLDSENPKYIKLLCELKGIKNFPKISCMKSKYKSMPSSKDFLDIEYNIYDGKSVSLNGLVSEINVIYKDSFPEVPEEWTSWLQENSSIYSKKFHTQKENVQAEMNIDPRYEVTAYNHLISEAYPIAGSYHKGIPIENIEQYFSYIGIGLQAKPYIDIISSKQLLNAKHLKISPLIKSSQITSLQDDILSGKIKITMPNETKYQSLNVVKDTIVSDICVISFKKV